MSRTPPDAMIGIHTASANSACQVDIDARLQSVARDVGHDDRSNSATLERLGEFDGPHLGRLGPALHGHPAFARIDADRDVS